LPPYQFFVQQQIASLGRNHPLIKSQYFSEEIDSEGGLFPTSRIALMQGRHTQQTSPTPGETYVFALDIAGADESSPSSPSPFQGEGRGEGKRDSTALTIARINRTTITDPLIHAPTYEVIARHLWTNAPQTALYAALKALADLWNPRFIVTDATGIGAGLTNFLQAAFPAAVIPFTFTQSSKSKLGWDFLAVIDSGRFKDYASSSPLSLEGRGAGGEGTGLQQAFRQQLTACQYEIKPGPAKTLVWSVPDGSRNQDGDYLHDDLIISAALLSTLDAQEWAVTGAPLIIPGIDPLPDMDKGF
jgi:hypothetical protein